MSKVAVKINAAYNKLIPDDKLQLQIITELISKCINMKNDEELNYGERVEALTASHEKCDAHKVFLEFKSYSTRLKYIARLPASLKAFVPEEYTVPLIEQINSLILCNCINQYLNTSGNNSFDELEDICKPIYDCIIMDNEALNKMYHTTCGWSHDYKKVSSENQKKLINFFKL